MRREVARRFPLIASVQCLVSMNGVLGLLAPVSLTARMLSGGVREVVMPRSVSSRLNNQQLDHCTAVWPPGHGCKSRRNPRMRGEAYLATLPHRSRHGTNYAMRIRHTRFEG